MPEFNEHKVCPVSGSTRIRVLKGYEKNYLVKSEPLGFVFCSRIPTNTELTEHYSKYNRHLNVPETTLNRYRQLLDEFEKYRRTNKILDVGCGMGDFLAVAKEKGWDVYGTEYTDDAIRVCKSKGISMNQGPLNVEWFQNENFDVITSFEVIEHINNPREDMEIISRLLRKGGVFYCTTPNFNAIERRILGSKYNIIEYPEHLCYYTKKTLKYLMNDFGLSPIWISTTGLSISRLKQALFSKKDAISEVSADEQIRSGMQSNKLMAWLVKFINSILNATNGGNALKGLFIKS